MYIVYKFGELWSTNSRDNDSRNCNFFDDMKKSAYPTNILKTTGLIFTNFSVLVDMCEYDENDICFVVTQGSLLW